MLALLIFALVILILLALFVWFRQDIDRMMYLSTFIRRRRSILVNTPTKVCIDYTSNKVCIVSGSISPPEKERSYSKISRQRLERYAEKHGYKLLYFTEYYNKTAPPIWQKIYAVQEALKDHNNEIVVWMDDDMFITNMDIKIEEFLNRTEKPIILSEDMIGIFHQWFPDLCWNFINTGIFVLRNEEITRQMIDETLKLRLELCDGYWNLNNFHEQSIITYLVTSKYYKETHVVKAGVMQSYSMNHTWKEGDFIIHLAGEKLDKRNVMMSELAKSHVE